MTQMQIERSVDQLKVRADQSRVIVHLGYQVTQSQKESLSALGLHLNTALGGTSYFATLDGNANANALSRSAVASISQINLANKLHKDLLAGIIRPWMLSQDELIKSADLRALSDTGMVLVSELADRQLDPRVAVVVMLHADADRGVEAARIAQAYNGQVLSQVKAVNSLVIALKPNQIVNLASDDAVMWVEPPLPQMQELNAQNRELTGANTLNTIPYALDGSGVTVMVYDGGRMFTHQDFGSRLTIGASDTAPISDHATHVGGTIGGDGTGNINNRGMAPGVNIISYGFEQPGGLMEGFLYTDPGDLEADYTQAILTYGSDISNNSIGTNTAPNGYPCDWTGNYGITSALIDAVARGSTGSPFRIVWANGNERQTSRCLGDDNGNFGQFFSTAPPACAKNHITVGSVDSDTDLTSSFSSWGPTDDGRIKPDISAPGCQAGGDGGVTSTNSSGSYNVKCGTSMASPTTTGISALILEQYRITFPALNDPMNATLKALLANSAVDRGNPGPDYKYGYGSIRGVAAVDTVIAQNVIESEVSQGGTYRGILIVGPGETELKVTMAWDDAPAAPNVTNALVNDLDLRIVDGSGNVYLPWTLNPANPDGNAVQSTRDGLNNIEQVSIANPAPGAYTVEVVGFNVAVGPTQTFGLVSSTTLINCSSAGIVGLGGNLFSCVGSTSVQVVDCDLNTSDAVIDSVDVFISSDSQPGMPLMMTLTETAPESATFTGSFSFADTAGSDVLVTEGDTLSVTYIDADDGNGNTNLVVIADATIDCTPPMVNSVEIGGVEPRSARVFVALNENSNASVHYGTSLGALNNTVSSSSFTTDHQLNLNGLTDGTTYLFTVSGTDRAGNAYLDDNNGSGYTFTTPDVPDFFTEQFASGLDLEGLKLTLTPNGTSEGYTPTIEPLDGGLLPFEPTDGVVVGASNQDDQHSQYMISGGQSIKIYDQAFTSFWISPNGYITNTSSTSWTETYESHFSLPRVAALYDDLNPSVTGTIYAQQLPDRVVVSWDRVAEYSNNSLLNTFQIELHFDGTIVISWERIDLSDAICGISEGNGVDPDFMKSDLSNYPAPSTCVADFSGDGMLDFFDISAFISAFGSQNPIADLNNDGLFNFFDISSFITLFSAGCP